MAEWFNIIGRVRRVVGINGGTPENPIELPDEPEVTPPLPGNPLPKPPPGVWPPPTPDLPIQPLPPGKPSLPPGMVWPNPNPPSVGGGPVVPGQPPVVGGGPVIPPQSFVVLVWISGGYGWRYVVVDPSLTPTPPMQPTPEPKK